VFALLPYIADLRGSGSVIFAMEEPEIALPPHAQRRMVDFVTKTMGQTIVTSHSPYVIELFGPQEIVVLNRDDAGTLTSCAIDLGDDIKPKKYREQGRQFAEAVLANAVLVVEGGTEVALYHAVADVLDASNAPGYQHPDLAGLTIFDAGGDRAVPMYGPVFAAMGKTVFAAHDTPTQPFTEDQKEKAKSFTIHRQISYLGIEDLLVAELAPAILREFLSAVASRSDYPRHCGYLREDTGDEEARDLARKVLKARKATEYTALLIAECRADQLPPQLALLMLDISEYMTAKAVPTTTDETQETGGPSGS
jgi:putative ATP-dependent endonuclease of the OLD family